MKKKLHHHRNDTLKHSNWRTQAVILFPTQTTAFEYMKPLFDGFVWAHWDKTHVINFCGIMWDHVLLEFHLYFSTESLKTWRLYKTRQWHLWSKQNWWKQNFLWRMTFATLPCLSYHPSGALILSACFLLNFPSSPVILKSFITLCSCYFSPSSNYSVHLFIPPVLVALVL